MAVSAPTFLLVDEDELFCEGILKYFVSQKNFSRLFMWPLIGLTGE